MGKRAVFAVKQGTNVYITTVQWADQNPKFFRKAVVYMSNNNNRHNDQLKELHDILLSISSEVTKCEQTEHFYFFGNKVVCEGGILGKPEKITVKNRTEFLDYVKDHDHSQDGYSVLVDLDANRMDFYISPELDIMQYPIDDKGFVIGKFGSITRDNYMYALK